MRIDHVALYVEELEAEREFFETNFGAEVNHLYHNPRTGLKTYFLSFGEGSRLELMQRPGVEATDRAVLHTGYTHVSFNLGSRDAVDALTAKLGAAGCRVESGPRVTGDGYYESCVLDPEGNRIELVG